MVTTSTFAVHISASVDADSSSNEVVAPDSRPLAQDGSAEGCLQQGLKRAIQKKEGGMSRSQPMVVLYVEDNPDDVFLFRHAMRRSHPNAILRTVLNGDEGVHYLTGVGRFEDRNHFPFPDLVFID